MKKVLMALAAAALMASAMAGPAFAKITPVDTACSNNGGQYPGGQQPSCGGTGLIQESENQNPAQKAPPGQNK